jgi:periplasmic divalent cation tolerance protein
MLIACTTVASRDDAENLAKSSIKVGLAVCVQIERPIASVYRWEGRVEQSTEFRLMFKLLSTQSEDLETHIMQQHPYDVPEWIVMPASRIGEKYLSWAQAVST